MPRSFAQQKMQFRIIEVSRRAVRLVLLNLPAIQFSAAIGVRTEGGGPDGFAVASLIARLRPSLPSRTRRQFNLKHNFNVENRTS